MASVNQTLVNPIIKSLQSRQIRYATFKIQTTAEKIEIVPDKQSDGRNGTWKQFAKELKDSQPRYCIYDYEFKTHDGRATSALYFIYWIPDNVNQNDRILYSSGKANIVHLLSGYKTYTIEEKDALDELLENEVVSVK